MIPVILWRPWVRNLLIATLAGFLVACGFSRLVLMRQLDTQRQQIADLTQAVTVSQQARAILESELGRYRTTTGLLDQQLSRCERTRYQLSLDLAAWRHRALDAEDTGRPLPVFGRGLRTSRF